MKKTYRYLVAGSINMDLVLKCARVPLPGESRIEDSFEYIPGGKGANQASALAKLSGSNVMMTGRIGKDQNGEVLKQNLLSAGVDITFLGEDSEQSTGMAVILLEQNGQNRILVYPGANTSFDSAQARKPFDLCQFDALLLQFEIPRETVIELCSQAAQKKMPIIVDAGPAQDFPIERLKGVTVFSPNETEVRAMTGIDMTCDDDYKKAARVLCERTGAPIVILKLGSLGAMLYRSTGESRVFPSIPVTPVDTTAAGDVFTAAFTKHFIETGSAEDATAYANYAAALSVTRYGALPSIPTSDEVDRFIRETV